MAQKSLREFSALIIANIRTGPEVNVGDNGFELKPALINMVQASQFCGKAHEDTNAHLQYFLEICSTFTIRGVTQDAIWICGILCVGFEDPIDPENPTPREICMIHRNAQATSALLSALSLEEYNKVIGLEIAKDLGHSSPCT